MGKECISVLNLYIDELEGYCEISWEEFVELFEDLGTYSIDCLTTFFHGFIHCIYLQYLITFYKSTSSNSSVH